MTSTAAQQYIHEKIEELNQVKAIFKNPKDLLAHLHQLLEENKNFAKQIQTLKEEKSAILKTELVKKSTRHNGIQILAESIDLDDSKIIKNLAYQLVKELEPTIILLGFEENGKAQLMCAISEDIVKSNAYDANVILKKISHLIEGGGGGQKFFATAGGKNIQGISAAIQMGKKVILEYIGVTV